jgi:hypothetical protein
VVRVNTAAGQSEPKGATQLAEGLEERELRAFTGEVDELPHLNGKLAPWEALAASCPDLDPLSAAAALLAAGCGAGQDRQDERGVCSLPQQGACKRTGRATGRSD